MALAARQNSASSIDGVFRALADPTRRRVLERLSTRPGSVSELAAPFKMALPSFVEHLKILERSGLVSSRKAGRVRTYAIVPGRLKLAEDWLGRQRRLWETRLDQLDAYLITMKETEE
ncbi:MAG: ArsR/SmtB family transcription factor [Parvibaculaceae bacterium]